MEFKNMHEERESGKKIIAALEAIDHWDALHKLDEMYLALDKENKSLNAVYEALSKNYATLFADNERNERSIKELRGITLDIAAELARAGDYLHGQKNDVILRVVARLIAVNLNYKLSEKRKEVKLKNDRGTPQFEAWEDVSEDYGGDQECDGCDSDEWTF